MHDVVTSAPRRAAYERAGLWDDRTLAGRVAGWAGSDPQRVAVVDEHGRHAVGEVFERARRVAGHLRAHGAEPGAVVSVQLPNRFEAVVTAVAIQLAGAVVNPLLPNYRARELEHVFRRARPAVIVTPSVHRGFDHRALVDEVRRATGVVPHHVIVDGDAGPGDATFVAAEGAGPVDVVEPDAAAVSELIFTSGTEATPKAIMHTEQTANFSVRVAYDDLGLGPDDVVWMPSPVGHSTGFNYGLRFALYHGLPLVLQDHWDGDDGGRARAAGALQLHARGHHVPAGPGRPRRPCRRAPRLAALLRLRRRAGAARRSSTARRQRGIGVLRLYGSTEVLVGTWNRPGRPTVKRTRPTAPP